MNTWNIAFWTPGHAPADDGRTFGCASHGFTGPGVWRGPEEAAAALWPTSVKGEALSGTYDAVLAHLGQLAWAPAAALVLFAHATGMEAFLARWQDLLPGVPVAGGAAARGEGQTHGELQPAGGDVAVLLLAEGRWRAEALNVHDAVSVTVAFRSDGPRSLTHLREAGSDTWQPAAGFFRSLQMQHGCLPTDCESITLCDTNGRNLHASFDGERLRVGADLPAAGRLDLRTVSRADAAARLAAFCVAPGALVFGCAGLRSLLDMPLSAGPGTLAGFFFGELVTLSGRPQFGNLMAARLLPER